MAAMFFSAKDFITSKITPDCLKASTDELKTFAKNTKGKFAGGEEVNVKFEALDAAIVY